MRICSSLSLSIVFFISSIFFHAKEITSIRQHQFFLHQRNFFHIPVERYPRNAEIPCNLRLAFSLKPCPADNSAFSCQFVAARLPSFGSAEPLALFHSPCSFRFSGLFVPLTVSCTKTMFRSLWNLQYRLISSFWFSSVCLPVLTRI